MIEVFVKRPATTIILILFFVLLGFVSYFNINIEQTPKIELPLVTVNVTYPGASPEEIESQVIKKIEDTVAEISEIKSIKSRSFESFGYVLIEFVISADVNVKSAEVKDKVDKIINDLPDSIDKPIVARVDPFAKSIMELALTSDTLSPRDLFEYADKSLKNQFSKIPGVGSVDLFGGEEREIRVELDPDLMRSRYVSINEVVKELKQQNLNIPSGSIDKDRTSLSIKYAGEFKNISEIQNLGLTSSDGSRFILNDIAKIYDGSKEPDSLSRFNGVPVVTLSVKKVSDGNEVNVAAGIRSLLPEIKAQLPQGMNIEVASDTSTVIVNETKGALQGIALGVLLTVLILYLFSGNFRLTFIAAVVIPSSIISSLLFMDISKFSINFITLLSMATALGTLIANAIVIIESVLSQLEKGKDPTQAAVDGTKEVVIPVIASCGTNLVVFTPIAFMGGIVGQFMYQFGLTVVYATLFSLLASFTLTPMMCALLLKTKDTNKKENPLVAAVTKLTLFILSEYKIIFNWMFNIPKTWLLLALASIFGTFSLGPYLGNEFVPVSDKNRIEVRLTLPQGSTIYESSRVASEIEADFKNYPEVQSTLVVVGENGAENARVVLTLTNNKTRDRSDAKLIEAMIPKAALVPNVEVEFKRGDGGGSGANADISLNIIGQNYDDMINASKMMTEAMLKSGNFRSLSSSYKSPKEEIRLIPNLKKMEQYGVTGSQLGATLRASIYGDDSNIFKERGEEYPIRVELAQNYKTNEAALESISLLTKFGLIPITDLGKPQPATAIPNIWRRDRSRVIQLNGYLAKSTAGVVQAGLTETFNQLKLPDNIKYKFVGNAESQAESGREIGKAFGLAIILTFMLLAAILNSFIHPFTISTSIFTSFGGVFVFLFFGNSSVNIASMLGFVMLVGLVVNNAILILDQAQLYISKGEKDIQKALWQGIEDKFRAVIMTSIAIIVGVLPQVWSPDLAKASMGLVIIGGTIASVLYTFTVTPIVFWYLERLRVFISGLRRS